MVLHIRWRVSSEGEDSVSCGVSLDGKLLREPCRELHRCRREIELMVHDKVHEVVNRIRFDNDACLGRQDEDEED